MLNVHTIQRGPNRTPNKQTKYHTKTNLIIAHMTALFFNSLGI